ncbi:SET domain-containing protein 5 [Vanrija pseudolonga]|uniref:SET domain-containing protein 5 n=1 Tax=Vanrija pseudolonga TaxID=143232 RepID=A0AAF0YBB6_9TREE|nr:SET domain-containing protein 5 [Vanrija pseudolonga]
MPDNTPAVTPYNSANPHDRFGDDLLLQIVGNQDPRDLIAASQVSKAWRHLLVDAKSGTAWRKSCQEANADEGDHCAAVQSSFGPDAPDHFQFWRRLAFQDARLARAWETGPTGKAIYHNIMSAIEDDSTSGVLLAYDDMDESFAGLVDRTTLAPIIPYMLPYDTEAANGFLISTEDLGPVFTGDAMEHEFTISKICYSQVMTDIKYKVVEIPGKGLGVVATADIAIGTRIIAEDPIPDLESLRTETETDASLMRSVKSLSPENQRLFLGLSNCHTDAANKFSGIFKTNAFQCGLGSPNAGIYPIICHVNHSCRPNAFASWNEDLKKETLHAFRDIPKGEEITIGYHPSIFMAPHAQRRDDLKNKFNFDCYCDACSLSPEELTSSDARCTAIREFDAFMNSPMNIIRSKPADLIRRADIVLAVLPKEFGSEYSPIAMQTYQDILQALAAHGSKSHMTSYGMHAHKAAGILQGYDHPNTKRNKKTAMDPTSHPNFGAYASPMGQMMAAMARR